MLSFSGHLLGGSVEINADKLGELVGSHHKRIHSADICYINTIVKPFDSLQDDKSINKHLGPRQYQQRMVFDEARRCVKIINSPETLAESGLANEFYSNGVLYLMNPQHNLITISKAEWKKLPMYASIHMFKSAGTCLSIPVDKTLYNLTHAMLEGNDLIHLIIPSEGGRRVEYYFENAQLGLVRRKIIYSEKEDHTRITDYLDFRDNNGIQYPMLWKDQTILKNETCTTSKEIQSAKFNPDLREENFVPKDLGMCLVVDERFNPPLTYHAKGQLPSDEQVVLFSQDKKALRQYEDEIESLNK
jgi:hypothetical protein